MPDVEENKPVYSFHLIEYESNQPYGILLSTIVTDQECFLRILNINDYLYKLNAFSPVVKRFNGSC
jgi:hypothetical protein